MPSLLDILQMAGQEAGRIGQGVLSAAALPGDVYSGRTPINDESGNPTPEVMDRALSLASLVGAGARPEGVPKGTGVQLFHRSGIGDLDHDYRMVVNGKKAGMLSVAADDPANIFVRNVAAADGPQSLGPSNIRALLASLGSQYPDAETISGWRMTGARDARGHTGLVSQPMPPSSVAPMPPVGEHAPFGLLDVLGRSAASGALAPQPVPADWQVY